MENATIAPPSMTDVLLKNVVFTSTVLALTVNVAIKFVGLYGPFSEKMAPPKHRLSEQRAWLFVKTQLVSVMLLLPSLKTAPPISAMFPSNLLPVTLTLLQFMISAPPTRACTVC